VAEQKGDLFLRTAIFGGDELDDAPPVYFEQLAQPFEKLVERSQLESVLGKRFDPGWDEPIGSAVVEKREDQKPLEKVTRCEEHFDEYGMREVHWFDADGKLIDIRFPLPEVAVE
jgi:hypothetical protein